MKRDIDIDKSNMILEHLIFWAVIILLGVGGVKLGVEAMEDVPRVEEVE